jgi:hypothetical protein
VSEEEGRRRGGEQIVSRNNHSATHSLCLSVCLCVCVVLSGKPPKCVLLTDDTGFSQVLQHNLQ